LVSVFLTALGGGLMRDVILQQTPYSFSHTFPALIILSVFILFIFLKLYNRSNLENNFWFMLSDTLGLVAFSISGASLAIEHNPKLCNKNNQTSNSHCAVGIYKKSSPNLWVKLKFFANTHNTSTITNFDNPIA